MLSLWDSRWLLNLRNPPQTPLHLYPGHTRSTQVHHSWTWFHSFNVEGKTPSPFIDFNWALHPCIYASFYVCWHLDKSHTELKRLLWTAQTIRKKNHQIQIIVSPIPVLSSLGINLELIHNTYASAQKAWEEKNCWNDIHTRTTAAALSGRIWYSTSGNRVKQNTVVLALEKVTWI